MDELGVLVRKVASEAEERAAKRALMLKMLDLPEDAKDDTMKAALDNHEYRIKRATHLGLPETATWEMIGIEIKLADARSREA